MGKTAWMKLIGLKGIRDVHSDSQFMQVMLVFAHGPISDPMVAYQFLEVGRGGVVWGC